MAELENTIMKTEKISAETEKQHAKPIGVKISCGMLNAINDEVLRFAFDAIAVGTPCEGMKLDVVHKPIQGRCKNCNLDFELDLSSPRCPKCTSDQFDLLPDAPLILEQIEFSN